MELVLTVARILAAFRAYATGAAVIRVVVRICNQVNNSGLSNCTASTFLVSFYATVMFYPFDGRESFL